MRRNDCNSPRTYTCWQRTSAHVTGSANSISCSSQRCCTSFVRHSIVLPSNAGFPAIVDKDRSSLYGLGIALLLSSGSALVSVTEPKPPTLSLSQNDGRSDRVRVKCSSHRKDFVISRCANQDDECSYHRVVCRLRAAQSVTCAGFKSSSLDTISEKRFHEFVAHSVVLPKT